VDPAGSLTAAIARNLRAERTRRGWSLEHLAARAGVSKGLLVQLEQERTNPTVATLYRVAEGLGLTVASLVAVADEGPVRLIAPDAGSVLWSGHLGGSGRLVLGAAVPGHMELWRWELRPGEACDGTVDPPGTHELVTVSAGALSMVVDGRATQVPEGGTVRFSSDRPHRYANEGEAVTRFHMVVTQALPNRP
jgi:transcriptional regulator with XRE-family HTH domain